MEKEQIKTILEAVLMASSSPLSVDALLNIFSEEQRPERDELQAVLEDMLSDGDAHSYELKIVSSGYRFQVKKDFADYVSRLRDDKPARYSRALLETMVLIAYRQPITRGEIEAVRGVSVSSQIIKTLDERNWIKVVGHRDVPGKPALYATTKDFLDYFNLATLDDLPSLQDIRDIDAINAELDLRIPEDDAVKSPQVETDMVSAEEQTTDDREIVIALETTNNSEYTTDDDISSPEDSAGDQDEALATDDGETVISREVADAPDDATSSLEDNAGDQDEALTTYDSETVTSLETADDSEDDTDAGEVSSLDDHTETKNGQLDAASASAER